MDPAYLKTVLITAVIAFSAINLFGCSTTGAQNDNTKQQQNTSSLNGENAPMAFPGANTEESDHKNIIIVFTVDDAKRIHVVQISGGYNLLTEYIRQSLEGRVLESDNAVPGINYVMTVKFPSTI